MAEGGASPPRPVVPPPARGALPRASLPSTCTRTSREYAPTRTWRPSRDTTPAAACATRPTAASSPPGNPTPAPAPSTTSAVRTSRPAPSSTASSSPAPPEPLAATTAVRSRRTPSPPPIRTSPTSVPVRIRPSRDWRNARRRARRDCAASRPCPNSGRRTTATWTTSTRAPRTIRASTPCPSRGRSRTEARPRTGGLMLPRPTVDRRSFTFTTGSSNGGG
mmetsp:Transcript_16764/g.48272  ORF Transcript_16764/g.48272 Transcript_16764/m.48272 type:complete len:221 (-) Transcript_16764:401-1063(-)